MSAVATQGEWDVVYTPFMLRVRAALESAERPDVRLHASTLRGVAAATDDWFSLRCRSEQMIAEANSMLTDASASIDLEDEFGTGRLAFVLRCRDRRARISTRQVDRQAWVELERSYRPGHQPVEPVDLGTIEDLVIELLAVKG